MQFKNCFTKFLTLLHTIPKFILHNTEDYFKIIRSGLLIIYSLIVNLIMAPIDFVIVSHK